MCVGFSFGCISKLIERPSKQDVGVIVNCANSDLELPLVSIGLPVLNGELYIVNCLKSLIEQTYPNLEIIVSVNLSDDNTLALAKEFIPQDSRIRILEQTKRLDALDNFGILLSESKGDYFMWAPIDDVWVPEFIEVLRSELEEHPNAIVAMGNMSDIDVDGHFIAEYPLDEKHSPNGKSRLELIYRIGYATKYIRYFNGLFRRDMLHKAYGVLRKSPDFDIWLIYVSAIYGDFRYVGLQIFSKRIFDGDRLLKYSLVNPDDPVVDKDQRRPSVRVTQFMSAVFSMPDLSMRERLLSVYCIVIYTSKVIKEFQIYIRMVWYIHHYYDLLWSVLVKLKRVVMGLIIFVSNKIKRNKG